MRAEWLPLQVKRPAAAAAAAAAASAAAAAATTTAGLGASRRPTHDEPPLPWPPATRLK